MTQEKYIRQVIDETGRTEITTNMICEAEKRQRDDWMNSPGPGLAGLGDPLDVSNYMSSRLQALLPAGAYDQRRMQDMAAVQSGQYQGLGYCPSCGHSLRETETGIGSMIGGLGAFINI